MTESIEVSEFFPAEPHEVYTAWLDSEAHSVFTGAQASVDARVGGQHTAWDGYIAGQFLALEPDRKIVQSWRTTEFPDDAPDSRVEIELVPDGDGTRLSLHHTDIPDGQAEQYREGWVDYYFKPLLAYLAGPHST